MQITHRSFDTIAVHSCIPDNAVCSVWTYGKPEDLDTLYPKGTDAALHIIEGVERNRDLSPWYAPACFRSGEDFSGGAKEHLTKLTTEYMPICEQGHSFQKHGIAGYSLAGLFTLYALIECPLFDGAASVSGSLWFPGFDSYLSEHASSLRGKQIYLSLGTKEALTRNAMMRPVLERTLFTEQFCRDSGASVLREENPGGHFNDPSGRTAKGIAWLCRSLEQQMQKT